VSQFRTWVAVLAPGACRGAKALTTLGAQIMDNILRRYNEARSWQRIEVILGRFFQRGALAGELEELLARGSDIAFVRTILE
jgi:hypothetical protein